MRVRVTGASRPFGPDGIFSKDARERPRFPASCRPGPVNDAGSAGGQSVN
jgi:hypothetical protein